LLEFVDWIHSPSVSMSMATTGRRKILREESQST
jgi:hypothetical protein